MMESRTSMRNTVGKFDLEFVEIDLERFADSSIASRVDGKGNVIQR